MSLTPILRLKQMAHLNFSSLKEFSTILPISNPLVLAKWKIETNDIEFDFHISWYNMASMLTAQMRVNNVGDTVNLSLEESIDSEVSYGSINQLQNNSLTYEPEFDREFDLQHGMDDISNQQIFFRVVIFRGTGTNDLVFVKKPSLFCYIPLQAGQTFTRLM